MLLPVESRTEGLTCVSTFLGVRSGSVTVSAPWIQLGSLELTSERPWGWIYFPGFLGSSDTCKDRASAAR